MKRQISRCLAPLILFLFFFPIWGFAQQSPAATSRPTTIDGWTERLDRFGKAIPQEKVYVHLDNTCYFLGDTIWYAAYTRRTDKDIPSGISRVLYIELLNQDGYLVERQLVEMSGGRGHGSIVLTDTLYGGFYELRAYTRWQLNWGITEKEHTPEAEAWFFNKDLAREFYRDYDKLYSRVFPVYDKPQQSGDFFRDMTTRPLRRYFKNGAEAPQPVLTLYPEGGNLVAGVPCRIAFEAALENGKWLEGKVALHTDDGRLVAEAATQNRGRGLLTFTPEAGLKYEASFTPSDSQITPPKASIDRVPADGVNLCISREGEDYQLTVRAQGEAASKQLGLTIMREGVVVKSEMIAPADVQNYQLTIPLSQLPSAGVHQATVFDADGRVWADRLFFVTTPQLLHSTLTVSGIQEHYNPFSLATLNVETTIRPPVGASPSSVSIAVRDASTQDSPYDNGTILTEMLLASEIKGFVPAPQYFFQADDEEHRQALDLLMLTQGWRRFDWHTMAVPGAFELTQPVESQTPVLRGEVHNYSTSLWQDDTDRIGAAKSPFEMEEDIKHFDPFSTDGKTPEAAYRDYLRNGNDTVIPEMEYMGAGLGEILETAIAQTYAHEKHLPAGSYQMMGTIGTARFHAAESSLSNEVRVHAEFTQPGSESIVGDMQTKNGKFTIQSPHFQGYCVLFLAASDTTKWDAAKPHTWISMVEKDEPEFYVRMTPYYPRFTQPYDYYQTTQIALSSQLEHGTSLFDPTKFETDMGGITVRASHGGLRRFDRSKPAYVVDAYTAYNEACDAGLMEGRYIGRFHFLNSLARLYVGDMNTNHNYLLEPRYAGRNRSFNTSAFKMDRYNQLMTLDSIRIYTDFNPRTGGDPRAIEDNLERVSIDLQPLSDDGERVTYRDRRYILQGFNVAEDFYHPNYSTPPAEGRNDYRRTLYWNPELQLDANGQAQVQFYTGSKPASIVVSANGQTADGTLLSTP
ncbi:MAG: hypothetical protein K6C30_05960 [Bacteroidaceae bacterium]|nr:hypothetical protein [Bacteroidaceae bacterium]